MKKIILLDLDNDVLNIIGDYVKADNIERMKIIKFLAEEIEQIKSDAKEEKKKLTKNILCADVYLRVYNKFYADNYERNWRIYNEIRNTEFLPIYEEYLKLKKSGFFRKNKK